MAPETGPGHETPDTPRAGVRARASARVERAFRNEERAGLMLAALVRAAMLLCATLYFALSTSLVGKAFLGLVASVLGLAMLGLLQFELLRRGLNPPWLKYLFVALDCAYLAGVLMTDANQMETGVPPALIIREGGILFFAVFLVQAAFSFSPRLVLWAGACIAIAWTAVLLDALADPRTIAEWYTPRQSEVVTYLARYANPAYLPLSKWTVDVISMVLLALGLSVAVARSRRLVAVSVAAERARANLARYFSPKMVDTLAARDEPFGQVRRQNAAVLFADLRGFTALAESTPPEEVMHLLREFHARMEAEVFDAGGTLDNIMGDGLMATFGVPDAGPTDASRALFCARSMLRQMERWNAERREAGLPEMNAGIGLNYGPVVLGDVGSERSSAFAVVGDTVNAASRLQTLTKEMGVRLVVSRALVDAVMRESGGEAQGLLEGMTEAGRRQLRGRENDIEVWVAA